MKNNVLFRRIGAYFIDIFVVMLINSALTYISFINPRYEEYQKYSEEYNNVLNDYYEKKIDINEFNDKVQDMGYYLNYNGYVYLISDIVIAFLYFGVFQYVTKGQTLGKKLLKIKVVSNKNKNLKLYNYLIRTFILNGVILNLLTLVAICLEKSTYYQVYNVAANIDYILMIVIFLMIMMSPEGRGLHDVLAGTKVIDIKLNDKEVEEAEIKEVVEDTAKDVKEETKKEVNKVKEVSKKSSNTKKKKN